MPDPIIPISAEFGETEKIQTVPVIKPLNETDGLDAFKKEMEKKATTVNEKDREDNRSDLNIEHQMDEIKPLIQEAIIQIRSKDGSILDPEKITTQTNIKTTSTQSFDPTSKKPIIITNNSESTYDSLPKDDNFAAKLPTPPSSPIQQKTEIEHVVKKMAPPPLTTPIKEVADTPHIEKKSHTPVQMETSSQQGDSSSKQKQPQTIHSEIKEPLQSPIQKTSIQLEKTTEQAPIQKPSIQLEKPTEQAPPKALPIPPKTPILENPVPKPLLTTHSPPPRIPAPIPAPLISQETPFQKNKEVPFTPPPPPIEHSIATPLPLEKPAEILIDKSPAPTSSQPLEAPPIAPLELAQKATSTNSSPFPLPFPIDTRKKEDGRSSKENVKEKEESEKILAPSESDSLQQEKKDEEENQKQAAFSQSLLSSISLPSTGPEVHFEPAVGFNRLSPQVLDLFDRLVGVITVLQVQGKTETTIHLNEQQSPLLQGTEITITRFDTASKSYNIEIKGSPQSVALLQQNVEQLKKSFQSRKEEFKFEVNEIRISLKEDKKK